MTATEYPVDFCYVQRQHISAINNLAAQFFWPGIDGELSKNNYIQ